MRLLLGVDIRRADAERLVDAAAIWATRLDATLDLAYVDPFGSWKPRFTLDRALSDRITLEVDRERARNRQRLEALLARVPQGQRGAVHMLAGDVGETIHTHARDYDALVLGPGERLSDQIGIASNAARLVRRAPGTVLVLPKV